MKERQQGKFEVRKSATVFKTNFKETKKKFFITYLSPILDFRMSKTGSFSEVCSESSFEWIIKDILSYTKAGVNFDSPHFRALEIDCCLTIYPNGDPVEESEGWILFHLYRSSGGKNTSYATTSIGLKKADGTIEKVGSDKRLLFGHKDYFGFQIDKFRRSELERRMSELMPSGDLTVVFNLRLSRRLEDLSRLEKMSDDFKDMLFCKRNSDAILKVRDEEFPVHRSVLSSRSSVFEAMFHVDMKEKETGVVNIPDCNPQPFRKFLIYLYSGKLEFFSDNVFELYRIADKYDVSELKFDCLFYIKKSISIDNLLEAYLLAIQFNEKRLQFLIHKFFNENFSEILSTTKWDDFITEHPILANGLLKKMAKRAKFTEK